MPLRTAISSAVLASAGALGVFTAVPATEPAPQPAPIFLAAALDKTAESRVEGDLAMDDAVAASLVGAITLQFPKHKVEVKLDKVDVAPLSLRDRAVSGEGRVRIGNDDAWIPLAFNALYDTQDTVVTQPQLVFGSDAPSSMVPRQSALVRGLSEQANRLNLKATVAQTISQIIATYRELLRAQEQLSIVQDALKRSGTLLEVNKALINAGRMAEFEIVQTEADIATQQLGVEEAQNQLDTNRLSLLRLLALDLSTPIRATEALEARPVQVDKRQAFNLAQTQQPEYLAALLGSQQADLNLVIAKDSGRWQVDLVAGANQIRDAYNNDAGSTNNRTWDSYAGVQVQIPIGDISTRQAEVRARVNVEDQEIRITDARQELERNVNDVVRDLGTRWRQYEISQRAVELSRRKIEIEREKLSAGRSTNFQVLSFETDLRNAENAQLNALIAYLNAQTQLDLTLGMTLESWEIALNDY